MFNAVWNSESTPQQRRSLLIWPTRLSFSYKPFAFLYPYRSTDYWLLYLLRIIGAGPSSMFTSSDEVIYMQQAMPIDSAFILDSLNRAILMKRPWNKRIWWSYMLLYCQKRGMLSLWTIVFQCCCNIRRTIQKRQTTQTNNDQEFRVSFSSRWYDLFAIMDWIFFC